MVRKAVVSSPLLETGCQLGEGSLWDERRQKLYFVDIEGCRIYTYDPSSGSYGHQTFDSRPTALALLEDDSGLLVSFDKGPGFVSFDNLPVPPTNAPSSYTPLDLAIPKVDGFYRFNEACVDPSGKRWMLGSMMHEGKPEGSNGGGLHCIEVGADNKLTVSSKLDDVTIANGMGWSRDNKIMFFTDSLRREIGAYEYDISTGEMGQKTTFSHFRDELTKTLGVPDGLCQDDDYGCWSARWGAGKVIRLDGEGNPDLVVEFPTSLNMTSCIFGGPNMDELYVTSAAAETPELAEQHPHTGHLFVVKGLGYRGKERTRFKGTFQ